MPFWDRLVDKSSHIERSRQYTIAQTSPRDLSVLDKSA